jgi:hypothetical protein
MNNVSRGRRYAKRWRRYQDRMDRLACGQENWFMGREYGGAIDAYWRVRRHELISRGVPSTNLTPVRRHAFL